MEALGFLREFEADRLLTERDLALGSWARARRRVGPALERMLAALARQEPELCAWLRILVALARTSRNHQGDGQLPLWPELMGPHGSVRSDAAARTGSSQEVSGDRAVHVAMQAPGPPGMGVITRDRHMLAVLSFLEDLAPTDLPILLEGESGTGKEVVARAIHATSCQRSEGFVAVNCGAIPAELHESELFGHTRGAYTGAALEKPGLFEAAHQGTLFLDEIGEMDRRAQVKLLRVLETGEMRRLGEVRIRRVQVRVIAATNACVDEAVASGRFRCDLLYRLAAIRVTLPPLRERPVDILPLAQHFLRRASTIAPLMTPRAQLALLAYAWPGNVRELKFAIERAAALWQRSGKHHLSDEFLMLGENGPWRDCGNTRQRRGGISNGETAHESKPTETGQGVEYLWPREVPAGQTLDTFLEQIERSLIECALEQTAGNRTLAARALGGLSRTTLIGKMKRLGLFEPRANGEA